MNHGTCESKTALNLVKTARGQLDAVIRLIEQDAYCLDVSKQLLASMALVKKANVTILRQHLGTCVYEAVGSDEDTAREKLVEIGTLLESYLG